MFTQNCAPATRRRLIARVFLTLVMGSWLVVASAGAAVRVAIIGDYGEDSAGVLAVANLVHGMSPDIVVTTGDNNYDDNSIDNNVGKYYARYIGAYTGSYPPGATVNRFFPSLGNHDYSDGGGLPEYLAYFTLPGAGVQSTNTSGNERYYDIVHGPIHFFVINSNAQEPDGRDSASVQAQWLRARLAATTSTWKIVILHHAPFSSGEHGSSTIMQWPYQAWGASIVIAGHDHDYERFVIDGFTYVVNGIGGRSLRNFGTIQPGSVVRYNANYGAMLLTGDATRLTFETIAVSPSGSLIDRFTLERSGGLPELWVSPAGISFGNASLGDAAVRTLVLQNAGFGDLAVDALTIVGAHATEFEVRRAQESMPRRLPTYTTASVGPFVLAPGESSLVAVRFEPLSLGPKTAALRVMSNDPSRSTAEFPLTGNATAPRVPDIGLSTSSLDFGGVLASSGTATHTLVVHNTGEVLLSVSGTSLVGAAAGEFRVISGAAPFGVAPGDSAIVQLQFAPTTTGTKSAALRLLSNDPQQGTQDVMLTGIGIASSATRLAVAFQESVDGGSTNSVIVATSRNVAAASGAVYLAAVTSRAPVSVSSVSGMGLAWTRLRAQCGGRQQTMIELWAGVGVPSAGAVTARFASAPNSAVIVVSRYGGAAASPFGTLVSGNSNGLQGACSGGEDTASYSLPLGTTAAGALVFVAAAVRNRDLTPGSGYTFRDEARAGSGGLISGLVTLDRTVATIGNVNVNGTLSNDVDWSVAAVEIVPAIVFPEITITPAAHDFGALQLGTTADTSFEIRNDGAASLQVPGVSVQGSHTADFAMTSGATVPVLAPGARHTVTVRFAPTAAGVRSAVLRIVSDDPDEITRDLPLTGTGVAAMADIAVAPSTVGFGSIPALTSTNQSLQVSNQGNVALHVTQVRVTGADSLSFTWTGATAPFSVLPGASTNLVLTFAPVTQGSKSAVLRLTSNDADTATLDVPLAGTALAPLAADIAVASDTLDFAAIAVFTNVVRLLDVRNVGTENLTVNAPTLLGPDAGMFTLTNPAAFTLAPGDSTTLTITFTPTSPGPKNAILRLTSNDPDESPLSITLTGVGAVPPEGHVVFEGSASGGATSKTTVTTTASLAAEPGDLVLAAITSKSYVNVTSVSGLGLSWTLVRAQCGARSQTGVQVWKGSGTPIPGVVTATFASAPTSAVIVVARYSGADPVTPLGTTRSANTLGVGGACSGGTDTASFGMSLQTTVNDAMVFAAVAMRSRVLTPGAGYAQREQFYAGPDGSIAGLAVVDQAFDVPGAVNVNGSFDGAVDWAVVGVEVRPYVGAAKQTAASPTAVYEAGLTVGHGIGVANRWVELTAPTPLAARVRLLDVRGRAQQTLFAGVLPAGRTRLPWGTTAVLPAGIYFVHAEIGTQRFVRKAVLLH